LVAADDRSDRPVVRIDAQSACGGGDLEDVIGLSVDLKRGIMRDNARRTAAMLVAALAIATPSEAQGGRTVLRGATVITATQAAPIQNAVIVIGDGMIQAIGPNDTPYPADARVVDLSGRFVIPGLVESHAHYEGWMGELFLNHGVTSAFAVGADLGASKTASHGPGVRNPRLYDTAGGPRIEPTMDESQVREAVRQWLTGTPDFGRVGDYTEASRRTFAWAADEMHRGGLLVFGHTMNAPESIGAGQDVIEHMWGFILPQLSPAELEEFQAGRYLHWSLFIRDWSQMETWMREAIARGAYMNPTLVYELGSLSAHAARHEREIVELNQNPSLAVYYPQNISQSLLQKQRQIRNFWGRYENLVLLSRLTPAEREEFDRGYQLAGQLIKRWVDLGGKIQAGTDTISGGTPGLSLHHEMELLVEAGLTPLQALQSATVWSAEMLAGWKGAMGQPSIGSLAPGMYADLVVLSADPLADITNTRTIERVMKGGEFVTLGYEPAYFSHTRPPRSIAMATPRPELSEISPHTVVEGTGDFDLTVRGVGFVSNSVVKINGMSVATTFVNPRVLKVRVEGSVVGSADPNRFDAPGPDQHTGVFGDRTASVSVFNAPPEGGTSNTIALRIRPKWMGLDDGLFDGQVARP
jgi:hypothetical protein